MPEGDTIFRAARTMARALVGASVTRFESAYAHVTMVAAEHPVVGRTVEQVRSLGKNLVISLSGDLHLRSHMRMNGSWHLYRPGERWQRPQHALRVRLDTPDFVAVGFDVPVLELLDGAALARHRELASLGPDALADTFDAAEAQRRLRARADLSIGEALLYQRALAGVGNVIKSEVLFLEGIDPRTPVPAVSEAQLANVVKRARALLLANVTDAREQVVTYAGMRRTTGRGDPGARLWVYGRRGQPCRKCGAVIAEVRQGPDARASFYCPRCQTR